MRSFSGRDILSLKDFEREEFFRVFEACDRVAPIARDRRNSDLLSSKTLVTAFYQPSTRTRLAHEAAMIRLGGQVTGFADAKMTRAGDFYQESIKDTVKRVHLTKLLSGPRFRSSMAEMAGVSIQRRFLPISILF